MNNYQLQAPYEPKGDQPKAIKDLVSGVNEGKKYQTLLGATGTGKTFTIANVIAQTGRPALVLAHNKTLAAQLCNELRQFFPKNAVEYFISYYDYYQPEAYLPVSDTYIEKDSSINEEIDKLRIKASTSLMSRNDVIVIASVSCIYGVGSPKEYSKLLFSVEKNQEIDTKELFKSLVNIHYLRNDMVLEPGIFRVRGDVVDIFPIYDDYPIRLEFFGNEIEKIYIFNPLTGEIIQDLESTTFYPCKNFVTTDESLKKGIELIRNELGPRLQYFRDEGKLLEAQRLEQKTLYDIEMMMELGYCSGIENYSRHLDGRKKGQRPYCLLDFFPDDFLMFVDESHVSLPQLRAMYNGDRSRKMTLVEHGFRLPSALDNRPMKFEEFEDKKKQLVYVSATPADYEIIHSSDCVVEQVIRPTGLLDPVVEVVKTNGQIDHLIQNIKEVTNRKERVLITTLTKRMSEDLTDHLKSLGIKCEYMHSEIDSIDRVKILRGLRLRQFDVLVGINLLREGLDIPEVSLVAILDADKEGFLRSETTLIQTIGRAARNLRGKAILYADKKTGSMERALAETSRRRDIQLEFNEKNNIKPQSIKKEVKDIMEGARVNKRASKNRPQDYSKDLKFSIKESNPDEISKSINQLEEQMYKYANQTEFEKAAYCRDKIKELKRKLIEV